MTKFERLFRVVVLAVLLSGSTTAISSYYAEPETDTLRGYAFDTLITDRTTISQVLNANNGLDNQIITGTLLKILVAFEFSDGSYSIEIGSMVVEAWALYPEILVPWFEASEERTSRLMDVLPVVFLNNSDSEGLFSQVKLSVQPLLKKDDPASYFRNKFIERFIEALDESLKLMHTK